MPTIKRHPSLQDLSRDHYVILNRVLQVNRSAEGGGTSKPFATSAEGLFRLWAKDGLTAHFEEEESNLLPLLANAPELASRLLTEHADLRSRLNRTSPAGQSHVVETAERLRAHVRWEEEHVFTWLQDRLSSDELAGLQHRSHKFREGRL